MHDFFHLGKKCYSLTGAVIFVASGRSPHFSCIKLDAKHAYVGIDNVMRGNTLDFRVLPTGTLCYVMYEADVKLGITQNDWKQARAHLRRLPPPPHLPPPKYCKPRVMPEIEGFEFVGPVLQALAPALQRANPDMLKRIPPLKRLLDTFFHEGTTRPKAIRNAHKSSY